jgi:Peptidase A4 family
MSRVAKFTTPRLEPSLDIVHGPKNGTYNGDGTATSHSACGLESPKSQWWTTWGAWIVPAVEATYGDEGHMSMWVGQEDAGTSLLQAGTEGILGGGYSAWYEWFPGPAITANLSISPGQTIIVSVGVVGGRNTDDPAALQDGGQVTLFNYSTGEVLLPIVVIEPPAADITEIPTETANWIVERPVVGSELSQLAGFGSAVMNGGALLLKNSAEIFLGENDKGTLLNMEDADGTSLAIAREEPELRILTAG